MDYRTRFRAKVGRQNVRAKESMLKRKLPEDRAVAAELLLAAVPAQLEGLGVKPLYVGVFR